MGDGLNRHLVRMLVMRKRQREVRSINRNRRCRALALRGKIVRRRSCEGFIQRGDASVATTATIASTAARATTATAIRADLCAVILFTFTLDFEGFGFALV